MSFNLAGVLDASAFPRFANAKGLSMAQFRICNVCLHYIPCLMTILVPPRGVLFGHGVIAMTIHVGWAAAVSNGTLLLDDLYVPLDPSVWCALWVSAALTEAVFAPLLRMGVLGMW